MEVLLRHLSSRRDNYAKWQIECYYFDKPLDVRIEAGSIDIILRSIEMAAKIAKRIDIGIEFVQTS